MRSRGTGLRASGWRSRGAQSVERSPDDRWRLRIDPSVAERLTQRRIEIGKALTARGSTWPTVAGDHAGVWGRSKRPRDDPEQSWKDKHAADLFAYERLMQRVIAQNALIWQTPSLGLAAQAFLLTTSLSARTGQLPRALASGLGVVLALMTMQLMAKHRFLMHLDREKMREIEARVEGLTNLSEHHRGTEIDKRVHVFWTTKQRSFNLWQVSLGCLLLLNSAIFVLTFARPVLFSG